MKNYFDFKLNGSTIFPYWVWIYLAYILMIILNIKSQVATAASPGTLPKETFIYLGAYFVYLIVLVLMSFFIFKMGVKSLSYKKEALMFDGDYKKYIKINIVGLLLSCVTLWIYSCWWLKNITQFFADSTSYNNRKFRFNGSGLNLFGIITVTIIIISMVGVMAVFAGQTKSATIIFPIIIGLFCLTTYIYLIYRWFINFSYDNARIEMKEGGYVRGTLIVTQEIFFTLITLIIYFPIATVKIYNYFVRNIEIRDNDGNLTGTLGSDVKAGEMFLFIWGQFLLSIITFGIYTPWAMCKIYGQFINKTYIEPITE